MRLLIQCHKLYVQKYLNMFIVFKYYLINMCILLYSIIFKIIIQGVIDLF